MATRMELPNNLKSKKHHNIYKLNYKSFLMKFYELISTNEHHIDVRAGKVQEIITKRGIAYLSLNMALGRFDYKFRTTTPLNEDILREIHEIGGLKIEVKER